MNRVLVCAVIDSEAKEDLLKQFPTCSFTFAERETVTLQMVKECDVIVGNLPQELLTACDHVRFMQLESAGSDTYAQKVSEACLLANASGCYGPAISEYMIGAVLSLFLHFPSYRDQQHLRRWENVGKVQSIMNAKVLVVGLGDIGSQFAMKMRALGAHVTGIRRHVEQMPEYVDAIASLAQLDELLPQMDVVASVLPNSQATQKVFKRAQFQLMKNSAVFINVGRGTAVDTEDLTLALKNHEILGAALDVTDPEPLPLNHPLWSCERLMLTPHIAGGDNLAYTKQLFLELVEENLSAFLNQEPLKNLVDRESGYRTFQALK